MLDTRKYIVPKNDEQRAALEAMVKAGLMERVQRVFYGLEGAWAKDAVVQYCLKEEV